MGSDNSILAPFIDSKVLMIMDNLTKKSNKIIEELVHIIRRVDLADADSPGSVISDSEKQVILAHCQLFKIDPKVMTDDEIREKERTLFKGSYNYITLKIRNELAKYEEEFNKAPAVPETDPTPFQVFLRQQDKYDFVYDSRIDYLNSLVFSN
jgi:hypothetical protein